MRQKNNGKNPVCIKDPPFGIKVLWADFQNFMQLLITNKGWKMDTDFSKPHYVAITMVLDTKGKEQGCSAADLALHKTYYCRLRKHNQLLLYGKTLHDTGLHIVLYVASDHHLAQIIEGDPLLKTEWLKINGITPFRSRSPVWPSIPSPLHADSSD